jgi:hypothetical protein
MGKIYFFSLALVAFCGQMEAQLTRRLDLNFADLGGLTMNPRFALAGGMGNAQFSNADLDGDGDLDLIAFDRVGNVWLPFENVATAAGSPNFVFKYEWQARFPAVESWALLRDYNCDGVEDIFCNYRRPSMGLIGIGVFRGHRASNGSVFYTLEKDMLFYPDPNQMSQQLNIFVSNIDIPAIEDVDGDGDLDILTFNVSGGFVELYRNRSQENGDGCDSLTFVLGDNCWGRFHESGITEILELSPNIDSCANYANWQPVQRNPRHSGSTVAALDMDNDGDLELFLGDISFQNIAMLRNGGTSALAFVDSQQVFFPANSRAVDLDAYPAVYFVDINNDGKRDMLATPSADDFSENKACVWRYDNIGTAAVPIFDFVETDFLVSRMLDFGGTSAPALVDFDGDGDLDLIVASNGLFISPTNFRRSLWAFENIGTSAAPSFRLRDVDFGRLSQYNMERMVPTFGDLDGDGDLDLLLGTVDGTLIFVENTGSATAMTFAQPRLNYASIDVGNYSAPCLFDLDEDGDLDLIVGERNGNLNYFENTGTAAVANFSAAANSQTFGFIDTRTNGVEGNSAPFVVELNGGWVLLVGNEQGTVLWYDNMRGNLAGTFTLRPNLPNLDEGRQSIATAADLNGDGLLDIIVGNKRGGLGAFSADLTAVGINEIANNTTQNEAQFLLFPNPNQAGQRAYIKQNELTQKVGQGEIIRQVQLFNAQGQLVQLYNFENQANNQAELYIDLPADLAQGLYFLAIDKQVLRLMINR